MKIIIIDDDSFICASLKTILSSDSGIEVAASGTSGEEAISLYDEIKPDILLMDIRMGGISGLEAAEQIIKKHPDAKILFLTTFSDDEYIIKALRIGAKGYLIKQNAEAIAPALRAVMSGQSVYGSEITAKLPQLVGENAGGNGCNEDGGNESDHTQKDLSHLGISERELDVIKQVAKGLSNKEIAELLYLSEGTVRNYLSVILEKLNLRDRTQLAVYYLSL